MSDQQQEEQKQEQQQEGEKLEQQETAQQKPEEPEGEVEEPEPGFVVGEEVIVEDEPAFNPLEDLHGTHNAAVNGLQTDASGSYTPPFYAPKLDD